MFSNLKLFKPPPRLLATVSLKDLHYPAKTAAAAEGSTQWHATCTPVNMEKEMAEK
jgi:hypothetical protein